MALVRVYCGLASAYPPRQLAVGSASLSATIVDDSGRVLDVCEIGDDSYGYAYLSALLAERASGQYSVAIAADSNDQLVSRLLITAGWAFAAVDNESTDDFADRFADEVAAESGSPPMQRRALGLARALQGGALAATLLPPPAELTGLKPVLSAHSALATGRHAAAVALREVLRELYPAALRAYSDPADPVALAVMEALPEPGAVASSTPGRGWDAAAATDAVTAQLAGNGVADQAAVTEAITALRVAVAETPRRGGIDKALSATVAETVRQSVAAVRACDAASTVLVKTLAEQIPVPKHSVTAPRSSPAHASTNAAPAPTRAMAPQQRPATAARSPSPVSAMPPSSGGPVPSHAAPSSPAPPHPAPPHLPPAGPQPHSFPPVPAPAAAPVPPQPSAPAPSGPPSTVPPPVPRPVSPTAPTSVSPLAGTPLAPESVASAPPPNRPMSPQPPPPPGITPIGERRSPRRRAREPEPHEPAGHEPAAREPDPLGQEPLEPRPLGAPSPEPGWPVSGPPPGDPFSPVTSWGSRGSDQPAPPVPAPPVPATRRAPDEKPTGSRADWPTSPPADDDWATPSLATRFSSIASQQANANHQASADQYAGQPRPEYRNGASGPASGSVTPPWRSDDLQPPEPPALRLVEPTLPDELRDDLGYSASLPEPARSEPARSEPGRPDSHGGGGGRAGATPPLRLVEPPSSGIPRSVPPVSADDDDTLLIFAQTRSAWFDQDEGAWNTEMDVAWRAAEQAAEPTVGDRTGAGLPRRVPHANLVPGAPPRRDDRPLQVVRDPASIAAHTSGYFNGWRRGQQVGGFPLGGRQGRQAAGAWEFHRDEDRLSG